MSANKPDEYGMCVYDIPQGNAALYHRIWTKIRRYAIRINLSVYLIPWGNRLCLQNIIEEAQAATGQKATFSILKYDVASQNDVECLAREQLNREIMDTMKRLQEKAQECLESGRDIPQRYLKVVQDRLDSAKSLSVIFGLVQDIDLSMQAALGIFNAHMDVMNAKLEQRNQAAMAQSVSSANATDGSNEMAHAVAEALPVEEVVEDMGNSAEAYLAELQEASVMEEPSAYVCSLVDTLVPAVTKSVAGNTGSVPPAGLEQFIGNVMANHTGA